MGTTAPAPDMTALLVCTVIQGVDEGVIRGEDVRV
jgi:hypothetical protein